MTEKAKAINKKIEVATANGDIEKAVMQSIELAEVLAQEIMAQLAPLNVLNMPSTMAALRVVERAIKAQSQFLSEGAEKVADDICEYIIDGMTVITVPVKRGQKE